MNPSRIFILRPVGTSLLMSAIFLTGLLSLHFIPISALPIVEYPTIQVYTLYPGAGPEVTTSRITIPLERYLGEIAGLKKMFSQSSGDASIITLQFDLGIKLDDAEQEVQTAINDSSKTLPADLPTPPIYAKVNPSDAPIMTLALVSSTMPLTKIQYLADTRIVQKISQVKGVGLVTLSGEQRPSIRIQANPYALAAYGIGLDDLRTVLASLNVSNAKGNLDGPSRAMTINANDQISNPKEYLDSIITCKDGFPIHLSDVAKVVKSAANNSLGAWMNNIPAIIINVQRKPGSNVISTAKNIQSLLPELKQNLPIGLKVILLNDRTTAIKNSLRDIKYELVIAIVLVILVIYLSLGNAYATLIPSLSVPLSLVGTLSVMYICGFSINNLSLMALTIATGFVVDDAIVMIENIMRYLEYGCSPLQAAIKGAKQISFTIISLTLSLIAVLIPLFFMVDIVGRLFHEFAITLAITIVISAIVALTLVPMMCAHLLKPSKLKQLGRISRAANYTLSTVINKYSYLLDKVLCYQKTTLLATLFTLVVTVLLYLNIPKGFFPIQDTNMIEAISEADQSVSFQVMLKIQKTISKKILDDPDVLNLSSSIGIDNKNVTTNTGHFLINLKERTERKSSVQEVIQRIKQSVGDIPGISIFLNPIQDLIIDSTTRRTQHCFILQNPDSSKFDIWLPKLIHILSKKSALTDVNSDFKKNGNSIYITLDRAKASRLGVTPAVMDSLLYSAFGQRVISTIYTQSSQYPVILEIDPSIKNSFASLQSIRFPGNGNAQISLSEIASIDERKSPLVIDHLSEFPAAIVYFNLGTGGSLIKAIQQIRESVIDINLPQSFSIHFQGAAMSFEASLKNEIFLILAAIIVMYIVLGILYESYIHPITILSTLPSAGIGALLALMIAGHELDIIGVIGIILLIGIVKKNAIMIVDFAISAERNEGLSSCKAIRKACLLRFRPILMTTLAALFGAMPLILTHSQGSEMRRPLGISIIGGLIVSQVLTLFTTPVIYLTLGRIERYILWYFNRKNHIKINNQK